MIRRFHKCVNHLSDVLKLVVKVFNDFMDWLLNVCKEVLHIASEQNQEPINKPFYVKNSKNNFHNSRKKYTYFPIAKKHLPYQRRLY